MSNETKLYSYWMRQLKRAEKKIPKSEWKIAKERLGASQKDEVGKPILPVVNDLRNHYESSRAYLDQRDPSFTVLPPAQFIDDPVSVKRAECERMYLESIWREQECQIAESNKLNSALTFNVGFTMPIFDIKKWMPAVRYLSCDKVRIDPDCQGIISDAKWWGYQETLSLVDFQAQFEIGKDEFEKLKDQGCYSLDKDDIEKVDDADKQDYSVVNLWHIFAKNSAALQFSDDDKVGKEDKKNLKEETIYRYLCLAEGLERPIKDVPRWPFSLDHNEHILTMLMFNHLVDDLYGFTDYKQMERMDKMSDNVMSYIESDAFFSSVRKYLGGDDIPEDSVLNNFINKYELMVMKGMLDESGNPKLKEVSLRQPNAALAPQYTLMHEQSIKASGQSELLAESTADLKDVSAMGIRWQEQKLHQRVNLRLSGPQGYEKSIQEDAIKLLEIAHQYVPRYSQVSMMMPVESVVGDMIVTQDAEQIVDLPWEEAKNAIIKGGTLLKLGIDAIVGKELAEYWFTTDEVPLEEIRLSTRVSIVPGSTRSITQEQHAMEMQDFYINVLYPTIYQPMNRLDLAVNYLNHIGKLRGFTNMDMYLPKVEETQQFAQQQRQMMEQQQQVQQQQAEQQMQMEQQNQQLDQQGKEQELQNQAVKDELNIEAEREKAGLKLMQMSEQAKEKKNAAV